MTMENYDHFWPGKSAISMAIFTITIFVYQKVTCKSAGIYELFGEEQLAGFDGEWTWMSSDLMSQILI